jgi:polysaccharide pyruvyl transferase WcaK-like protein
VTAPLTAPLTILCAGAYGIRNAGDDLPLIALMEGMRAALPDRELRFRALSRHPDDEDARLLGAELVPNLEYESGEAARGRWFRGLNPDDDPEPFQRVQAEIAGCDLLVLGAGNALLDQTIGLLRGPVPLMSLYGWLARLHHRPVMLYGMSVGPLQTAWGRDLSRQLIADAAVVTVRDSGSFALCRELLARPREIHLLPDATLAVAPPASDRAHEVLRAEGLSLPAGRPVIALGLRDLARPLGAEAGLRQEKAVLGLIERWRDRAAFLFVPQSTYREDDDRMLAERLAARAPAGSACLVVRGRHHPLDLVALYGLAAATVASRLHGAVFSAIGGTPPVGLDYLPKMRGFLDHLPGCHERVSLESLTSDALDHAVATLLADDQARRRRLASRVSDLRAQAARYATLAVAEGLGAREGAASSARRD